MIESIVFISHGFFGNFLGSVPGEKKEVIWRVTVSCFFFWFINSFRFQVARCVHQGVDIETGKLLMSLGLQRPLAQSYELTNPSCYQIISPPPLILLIHLPFQVLVCLSRHLQLLAC